jgi:DNA modification methylase
MSDERLRANDLDGRTWLRHSISVWSDVRKTPQEAALAHPALFPQALVARLLACFTNETDQVVLDPFAGVGSTLLAACDAGKQGVGLELNPDYVALMRRRLRDAGYKEQKEQNPPGCSPSFCVYESDARNVLDIISPTSIDFCVTSPPYWDILRQRRTADGKPKQDYGAKHGDLGSIADYQVFLDELTLIFRDVHRVLRPGAYCIVVVMDLRKRSRFFPLHADLAMRLQGAGFIFDDLIIWDRRQEYNNLRPLGYPYKFRINKVHEFLLVFQKRGS